ncbi:MAG: UDP-N-acetylmuramoyl-L-alanyl-D-glutamate--2,6-diaminopimelate ligase [Acidobacteria bacterium]|nr:MAG: UDP-N-acetylmuramoyl-L-alanyl-D-glutamate--2,6-diaminopimelate ligase [Acidobacteriota bacterium]
MTLGDLLAVLGDLVPAGTPLPSAAGGRQVKGLAYDSRRVVPGSLFVALKGQKTDGAAFAVQALSKGAVAVVAEAPRPEAVPDATWIHVRDGRHAMARLAAAFYGRPSDDLQLVGITGTNGKTTTAYLLSALFEAAGIRCGMLGTVVYRVGREERPATRTTPEAVDVQHMLREMVQAGCSACAMEVSSHALVLDRVADVRFRAGVFTNLTRDHLDFHGAMETYFKAKLRLFEELDRGGTAVVNVDDPRGPSILPAVAGRTLTYAIDHEADVKPGPIEFSLDGLAFSARTPAGPIEVRTRLVGRPNAYNVLATAATGVALGLPLEGISRGLGAVEGVPGRFEIVSGPRDDVNVVVDYAHTDDALRNLLETARPLARHRLITVFGCGGDRDRTKRPLMGAVATRMSDLVIVTSDNPRTEDPAAIIAEIRRGIPPEDRNGRHRKVMEVVDRRTAIERAINLAEPGDVVLLAGKGHEKYQVIGDKVLPFDDAAVARAALARRREAFESRGEQ